MILKQHLIFDMDGVLWNTCGAHEIAYIKTLIHFDIPHQSFRYNAVAGMATTEGLLVYLKSINHTCDKSVLEKMIRFKRELAHLEMLNHPEWAALSAPILQALSHDHVLVLASSGSRRNIDLFLDITHSRNCFKATLSAEDVCKAKPNPEIYLSALKCISACADNSMVIEDALIGIQAAQRAGIQVIGIAGTQSREELLSLGIYAVIDRLEDLLPHGHH